MIALSSECLLVRMPTGEAIPCSADMVSVEVEGDAAKILDVEFVTHATSAVFHYFKNELGQKTVSAGELAGALEKVLRGFALMAKAEKPPEAPSPVGEADLGRLAQDCGQELIFFPRLREELRRHLRHSPRVLRFQGLRRCVKHLAGARRWGERCRTLETEIIDYLRQCLQAEPAQGDVALWVE